MNPYAILVAVALWGSTLAGASYWAYGAGKDSEVATQAREDKVRAETRELAQQSAAEAISEIKVQHRTIKAKVEHVITKEIVYRECRHPDPSVVRDINEALAGKSHKPAGDSKLPGKLGAAGR